MPEMRRVLVLNHFAVPLGEAGGTRHVELFSRVADWEHLIVASNRNALTGERIVDQDGFKTIRVNAHSSNGWRRILSWALYALSAVRVGLASTGVTVVYASSPHLLTGLAGLCIARARRLPLILEVRDLWPQVLIEMGQLDRRSWTYRVLSWLEGLLYRSAAQVVVLAHGSIDDLARKGVPREKVSYIPNGPDVEDFSPTGSRAELRARYGFDRFTAIYAGAHGPANGLDLLLRAAEQLKNEAVDLILVGGGIAKEGLVAEAHARGLQNVRFWDPVPKSQIPDLLYAADLGLHVLADVPLFRTAVSPNKLFDYMAAGLPTLTNCPGLVSEISLLGGGFAVSPNSLGDGIVSAMAVPSQVLRSRGQAGRDWIQENQSRTAMATRLASLLDSVVNDV